MAVAGWCARPLELLQTGGPEGKHWAAKALRSLAATSAEHRHKIVEAGALPLLLELLRSGTPEAREEAAGTLRVLTANSAPHQDAVVRTGAIPDLVAMLRSAHRGIPGQVAGLLANIASGSEAHRRAVVAAGAVPPLVKIMRSNLVTVSFKVQNVEYEGLGANPPRGEIFSGIVKTALIGEVGHGVRDEDVMLALSAIVNRYQAIQTPGVLTQCTVTVNGSVDVARVQGELRRSATLGPTIAQALTAAKLAENPLRKIVVEGLSTPASVVFSIRPSPAVFAEIAAEPSLLLALTPRVRLALDAYAGPAVDPVEVSVTIPLGTRCLQCGVTPADDSIDAGAVQRALRPPAKLAEALLAQLQGAEDDQDPLSALFAAPVEEFELSEPELVEVTYANTGTLAAQMHAAGAMKHLVMGDTQYQELALAEGAVPALIGLLHPGVPFGDLFQIFNSDGGGGISEPELALGLKSLGYLVNPKALWMELDMDGSGNITWKEFVDRLTEALKTSEEGVVGDFVGFLRRHFDETPVQEQACCAVRALVDDNTDTAEAAVAAGAVPPLIELAKSGANMVREQAKGALAHLAALWCKVSVEILETGTPPEQERTALELKRLASISPSLKNVVVETGAVPPLVALAGSGPAQPRRRAIAALRQIMSKCPEHEKTVVAAGAVPPVLGALKESKVPDLQEEAVRTVRLLVERSALHQARVVENGGLELLVGMLKLGAFHAQVQVIDILSKLAQTEFRKPVLRAGFHKALVELALADDPEVQRRAAEAAEALGDG